MSIKVRKFKEGGKQDGTAAKAGSDNAQAQWLNFFQNNAATMSSLAGSFASSGGNTQFASGMANAFGQAGNFMQSAQQWGTKEFKALDNKDKATNIMGAAGAGLSAIAGFMPERESLSGQYGSLSQSTESMVDMVGQMPGMVGAIYNAANGLSDIAAGAFGDTLTTSGSTKADAILDAIPGLGLLNAGLGSNMEKMSYDQEAWNTVGGSYAGSQAMVKDAAENTGGRYGIISKWTGAMQKDAEQNRQARLVQDTVSKIGDEAKAAQEIVSSTIQEATLNEKKRLAGNNLSLRVQKGMKIPNKDDIQRVKNVINSDYLMLKDFKPDYTCLYAKGGKTEEKPKTRSLEELIQYAKEQNPRFVQRMTEPLKYLDLGNGDSATHLMAWDTDDQNQAYVYPTVMEDKEGNLYDYKDAAPLVARERGDYLIMSPEEAELFTSNYKQGWPMFFQQTPSQKFAKGGTMNIIPEGELHARLHHMEQEGITKKGIPVISEEEGGEIIQHAEIERNEIIFRLEVTKKLEELMEDGSDEAALEAGKLLVEEILNNTEDRTGLIDEVQ